MQIEKLFFSLIKVAIGKEGVLCKTPTAKDWQQLYDMAKKQSLVGICFAGVQKLVEQQQAPEEMLYLTWMGMAAKIQQRNEVVNKQCVELQERLMSMGYQSCIIKGQSNHPAYGSLAMLRQSGDIDIWIEGGRERVVELVNKICPTKKIHETHAELDVFQDTEVEAHYRPGLIRDFCRNIRLQKFFHDNAEACFTNKVKISAGEIVAGTPRFNAVQQLLHIYHHLFDGGIGLRQVMDYHYVLCSLPTEERKDVMCTLKSLGVKRFIGALMYVLQEVFGMERSLMLCEPNGQDGAFLLSEIIQAGNFGHYDERNKKFNMQSYWQNFFGIIGRNLSYVRFAPWDWLMSPLWRIYHFVWRKMHGYH